MTVAVTHDESAQRRAQAEQNETIFVVGMVRVIDEPGMVVQKDRLSFLKRDAVLVLVGSVLPGIPFKPEASHDLQCTYIVSASNRSSPRVATTR